MNNIEQNKQIDFYNKVTNLLKELEPVLFVRLIK